MALIMYLTKAPRYKNIFTDEYEDVQGKDIVLTEKYFRWGMAREEGTYACDTFEEWCGVPESELPHKYVINYYRDHFSLHKTYSEIGGEIERHGIFEHLARIVKANQILKWFITNVMDNNLDMELHIIRKDQLEELLTVCNKVVNENVVNIEAAKELLPIMEDQGYFFGTDKYDEVYAEQVISMVEIIKNILTTTDFEKEAVYFNSVW